MSNAFDIASAPTTEPTEIIAGDYTQWKRSDLSAAYPTADYTLRYVARSNGQPARKITFDATPSGNDYLVQLPSATTAQYTVATYAWKAYIIRNSDGERVEIDNGIFLVDIDSEKSADDPRNLPQKMLAEIERALLSRATNSQLDVLAYSLGVESSATRDPAKLLEHREYWKKELVIANRKARARKGLSHSGIIRTRF